MDIFKKLLNNVVRPNGKRHLQNMQLRIKDVSEIKFVLPITMAFWLAGVALGS